MFANPTQTLTADDNDGQRAEDYAIRLIKIKSDIEDSFSFIPDEYRSSVSKSVRDIIDKEINHQFNDGEGRLNRVLIERTGKHKLNNRRSEIEVLATILDVAKKGVRKTKILYKANLSYSQLKSYLLYLNEKDLLDVNDEDVGTVYSTTQKGHLLLKKWKCVVPLLE